MDVDIKCFLTNLCSKISRFIILGLEVDCSRNTLILLLGFSLVVFVVSHSLSGTYRQTSRRKRLHEALVSVLIPTSTAWPTKYSVLLDNLTRHQSAETIQLVASSLLKAVYAGLIEVRSAQELSHLLRDELKAYGCRIRLIWDVHSRCSMLKWLLISQLPFLKYQEAVQWECLSLFSSRDQVRNYATSLPAYSPPLDVMEVISLSGVSSHSAASIILSDLGIPSLYLDLVSYPALEPTIRALQSRLQPGRSATIEFTTVSSKFPFFSDKFMSCCLPFLPRKYLGNGAIQRTSTPLLTSCHEVTQMLISDASMTIHSITNTTNRSIFALKALNHNLVANRSLRSTLLVGWGEHGWREHVFLLEWEVGLLASGLLTRWSIAVRKQAAYNHD